jgi:hypothetical protein
MCHWKTSIHLNEISMRISKIELCPKLHNFISSGNVATFMPSLLKRYLLSLYSVSYSSVLQHVCLSFLRFLFCLFRHVHKLENVTMTFSFVNTYICDNANAPTNGWTDTCHNVTLYIYSCTPSHPFISCKSPLLLLFNYYTLVPHQYFCSVH